MLNLCVALRSIRYWPMGVLRCGGLGFTYVQGLQAKLLSFAAVDHFLTSCAAIFLMWQDRMARRGECMKMRGANNSSKRWERSFDCGG